MSTVITVCRSLRSQNDIEHFWRTAREGALDPMSVAGPKQLVEGQVHMGIQRRDLF